MLQLITKKIKRAKTDPQLGLEFDNPERPEADNLLKIYSILSNLNREEAAQKCSEMGWGKFKPLLTDATVSALQPIQAKYQKLMAEPEEIYGVLKEGRDKAEEVAQRTLQRAKKALGFLEIG